MLIAKPPAFALPRFCFRQLERADKHAWYAYLSNRAVYEHTSWSLKGADDLDPLFNAFELTTATSVRRLAIIESDTQRLAGTIGFHTISDVNRSAELAYDLNPEFWGIGLATAAARTVVEWAQAEYGFVRTQATALTTNHRSARVLEKCGFKHEGLLRAYRMVRGVPGDFNMYSAIREENP